MGRRGNKSGNAGMRRCLGPGPEHEFWSPDKTRFAVCKKCRRAMHDTGETANPVSLGLDGRAYKPPPADD